MSTSQYIATMHYLNLREYLSRLQLLSDDTISDDYLQERKTLTDIVGNGRTLKNMRYSLQNYAEALELSVIGRERLAK